MKTHWVETNPDGCHWVGIDVAKLSFDAALVQADQHYPSTPLSAVPVRTFARTAAGVEACLTWLKTLPQGGLNAKTMRACMEATGAYSEELAVWLLDQCPSLEPAIVNPRHTSAFITSMGLRNKTDKLEARALGFYGVERQPAAYEPLTPERAALRDLSRCRAALVAQKTAEGNRAQRPVASKTVLRVQNRRLRQLARDIERVEAAMKEEVRKSPELTRDVRQLTSIYGVGFITAVVVLAELGDLRRFHRARQLTAFAGVTPRVVQSGTSVNEKPHLCKQGNPRVRHALYLAALTATRGRSHLQRCYCRLIEQGKPPKAALGAVMRKLLTIMRAILISGKPYEAYYRACG
jgi:transposase